MGKKHELQRSSDASGMVAVSGFLNKPRRKLKIASRLRTRAGLARESFFLLMTLVGPVFMCSKGFCTVFLRAMTSDFTTETVNFAVGPLNKDAGADAWCGTKALVGGADAAQTMRLLHETQQLHA